MKEFMNKKRKRKAFTIVELVIVIAVIAILATVLVPTFSSIVDKAQDSAALQEARNKYLEIYADDIADGVLDMKSPTANLTAGGNDADGKWTYYTDGSGNVANFTYTTKNGITVAFDGKNDWKVNGQSQSGGSNNHTHTEVIDKAVNPTCTDTGLTEGKHCSACDTVTVAQTTVAALGHTYNNLTCMDCGDKVVDNDVKAYLTFDGNVTDSSNNYIPKASTGLSFDEGYWEQGADLSDGHTKIEGLTPSEDSFTLSLWIKKPAKEYIDDPVIVGNKDWDNPEDKGFILSWDASAENRLVLNVGDGTNRADIRYVLPDSIIEDQWIHIVVVAEAGEKACIYVNFTLIPDEFTDGGRDGPNPGSDVLLSDAFSGMNDLYIGQDGTGEYDDSLNATIDEFIYFDGALTAEDVAELADYYREDYSEDDGGVLKVMSFNVYYDNSNKQGVIDQITQYMPDSFGVQEATKEWMTTLGINLSLYNYAYVGDGRGTDNDISQSEYNAVFYRKDKFNCLGSGTKWLSKTPDKQSKDENLTHFRIVTWAVLERKSDGKKYIHANTHLDDSTDEVRLAQAGYLLGILAKLSEDYPGVPIILTGDFNTDWQKKDDEKIKAVFDLIAEAGYVNAASVSLDGDEPELTTWHGNKNASETIDFAFVREDDFTVLHYNVCDERNPAPSDHYALYFEFAFK